MCAFHVEHRLADERLNCHGIVTAWNRPSKSLLCKHLEFDEHSDAIDVV
jgi:U3 small nucleolar ribonucleoprotein component